MDRISRAITAAVPALSIGTRGRPRTTMPGVTPISVRRRPQRSAQEPESRVARIGGLSSRAEAKPSPTPGEGEGEVLLASLQRIAARLRQVADYPADA